VAAERFPATHNTQTLPFRFAQGRGADEGVRPYTSTGT